MATIYTQQLANIQYTGEFIGEVYTVPADTTVIITDVDAFVLSLEEDEQYALLLGAVPIFYYAGAAAQQVALPWRGRQVLMPGQQIYLEWTGADLFLLAITGYVLGPL